MERIPGKMPVTNHGLYIDSKTFKDILTRDLAALILTLGDHKLIPGSTTRIPPSNAMPYVRFAGQRTARNLLYNPGRWHVLNTPLNEGAKWTSEMMVLLGDTSIFPLSKITEEQAERLVTDELSFSPSMSDILPYSSRYRVPWDSCKALFLWAWAKQNGAGMLALDPWVSYAPIEEVAYKRKDGDVVFHKPRRKKR